MERQPLDATFARIVQQLQREPQRYRLSGVYWWAIKAMLIRRGYGPVDLYLLGSYQDPETAQMIPPAGLAETLHDALAEYGFNAALPHPDGQVENPDGEMVRIFDEDANL